VTVPWKKSYCLKIPEKPPVKRQMRESVHPRQRLKQTGTYSNTTIIDDATVTKEEDVGCRPAAVIPALDHFESELTTKRHCIACTVRVSGLRPRGCLPRIWSRWVPPSRHCSTCRSPCSGGTWMVLPGKRGRTHCAPPAWLTIMHVITKRIGARFGPRSLRSREAAPRVCRGCVRRWLWWSRWCPARRACIPRTPPAKSNIYIFI